VSGEARRGIHRLDVDPLTPGGGYLVGDDLVERIVCGVYGCHLGPVDGVRDREEVADGALCGTRVREEAGYSKIRISACGAR
jgi:hypothetical protein